MKKIIIAAILGTTVALASAGAMATTYEIVNKDGGQVNCEANTTDIEITQTTDKGQQAISVTDGKGTVQCKNTAGDNAFKIQQDDDGAYFIISDSEAWHGTDCYNASDNNIALGRDQYIQGNSPVTLQCLSLIHI